MRSVRLIAPGEIEICDLPDPKPGPGDIVIKVEAAGVCGTDRHLFKGEFPSVPGKVLGHEFSGVVVDPNGHSIAKGSRVTCDPNTWCGACPACLRGQVNLCQNNIATGIHRDGGFSTLCAFPAHKAHLLPADLDPLHGAFCEPLACTIHGMDIGAARPGERVCVIGGGVIGLMAVALASRAGAEVMLLTRSDEKQALGRVMGAHEVAASPEAARAIWDAGADLVVECAGVPATVEMAPRLTRAGGRIVILGVLPDGEKVQIEPFDLLFREIQMHFSFLNPFTHQRAADMIASGHMDVSPLISRIVTLCEVPGIISAPAPTGEVRSIAVP